MQNNRFTTDGFVVRRRAAENLGRGHARGGSDPALTPVPSRYLIDPSKNPKQAGKLPPVLSRESQSTGKGLTASDETYNIPQPQAQNSRMNLDLNLDEKPDKPKKVRKKRPIKKILKWVAIGLLIVILAVAGYFAYKVFLTSGKIFKGNPISAIFSSAKPLKADANGNSNILLFGTSEDDGNHPGAELTDSIMLASINQQRKDGFLVSIPRDLWVDYGRACPAGYQGKINALYPCVKDASGEDAGQQALMARVGQVLGLDIQYAVHVNYTVLKQSVDAVGGITVTIASSDPRGVLDRNFDWNCPKGSQTCYNVKYPNGPVNLNGQQALYLARARGDDPLGRTYGFSQGNFDREKYQREILIAIKDKATSAGILSNPVAVNNLLDALGNNVRTNFGTDEIKTLMQLGKDINSSNIKSVQLNDPANPIMTTGMINGQSIVKPSAGLTNFSALQAIVAAYATNNVAAIEGATIDVLNASAPVGSAQTQAKNLANQGLKVGLVGDAPAALGTQAVQFYDMSGGKKPATLQKLQSILGVKVTAGKPAGITSSADFVVILGASTQQTTGQ